MATDSHVLAPLADAEDLKQRAYRALKQAILDGRLQEGLLYKEIPLAAQLGVSRTPVREALLVLAAEGWVRYLPRRGIEIIHPTAGDAVHIFELRQALEGFAVDRIAGRIETAALQDLDAILAEQGRHCDARDWPAYMEAAARFHARLVAALGNPRFDDVFHRLTERLQQYGLEAIHGQRSAADLLGEHRQILAAITAGDGERGRRLMIAHLQITMDALGYPSRGQSGV